jgi:hypothetical protein
MLRSEASRDTRPRGPGGSDFHLRQIVDLEVRSNQAGAHRFGSSLNQYRLSASVDGADAVGNVPGELQLHPAPRGVHACAGGRALGR